MCLGTVPQICLLSSSSQHHTLQYPGAVGVLPTVIYNTYTKGPPSVSMQQDQPIPLDVLSI